MISNVLFLKANDACTHAKGLLTDPQGIKQAWLAELKDPRYKGLQVTYPEISVKNCGVFSAARGIRVTPTNFEVCKNHIRSKTQFQGEMAREHSLLFDRARLPDINLDVLSQMMIRACLSEMKRFQP